MMQAGPVHIPMYCTIFGCRREASSRVSYKCCGAAGSQLISDDSNCGCSLSTCVKHGNHLFEPPQQRRIQCEGFLIVCGIII